jgi:hypothetical protein
MGRVPERRQYVPATPRTRNPAGSEAARKTGKAAAGAVPESAGCTEYRGRADDSDPAQLVALCWNRDQTLSPRVSSPRSRRWSVRALARDGGRDALPLKRERVPAGSVRTAEPARLSEPWAFCADGRNEPALPPQAGESGTRPAGSSAPLSAKRRTCVPALLSPTGGSRLLVVAIPEGRPNTQRALSGRPRADEAIAKCFSFLAGLELGEDLPCLTVDDDECLQGAEP